MTAVRQRKLNNRNCVQCVSVAGLVLLVFCLHGCESRIQMGHVTGRVTYQGNPITNATIEFRPEKGPGAFCSLDSEGRYVLQTKSSADGVAVGKNVISIVPVVEFDLLGINAGKKLPKSPAIPEKFRRGETSGLVREIKPGNNVFDFELKE